METIGRLGLPLTLAQFSDGCFGWIKVSQELFQQGRCFGVDFSPGTDHAATARPFGLARGRPAFVDIVTECETGEFPPVTKWQRASRLGGSFGFWP